MRSIGLNKVDRLMGAFPVHAILFGLIPLLSRGERIINASAAARSSGRLEQTITWKEIMSPDQVLRAWYEEVWNKANSAFIYKHMANPCRIKGLPMPPSTPEQFEAFQQGLLANIKNMRVEVVESLESGTRTIGICRTTGIDAKTNRPIDFYFAYSAVVENDKVVEAHNIVDFLTYLQQTNTVSPTILAEKFGP